MNLTLLDRSASLSRFKPLINLQILLIDIAYPIVGAKVVKTTFGEAEPLELEKKCIFLPN